MKNKKIITNAEIVECLMKRADCENANQFSSYLTETYGIEISRQQVSQFQKSDRLTITHLLLREALKN